MAPQFTQKWRVECLLPLIKIWPCGILTHLCVFRSTFFKDNSSECTNHPEYLKRCRIVLLRNDLICDYNLCVCLFWPLSPHSWCSMEIENGSSCSPPYSHPCSLFLSLYLSLSPPSHLIAFDKCPYRLHIIRCSRGSLRLYYSAHTAQLFSILHAWHTRFRRVQTGPKLCQQNSFTRRALGWWTETPNNRYGDMVIHTVRSYV